jgi:hypothetical protein
VCQRLRWARRFYPLQLLIALPASVLLLIVASGTLTYIVLGAGALLWLEGYLSLSIQIRRAERSVLPGSRR